MKRARGVAALIAIAAFAFLLWKFLRHENHPQATPTPVVQEEKIPVGIIVTESSSLAPPLSNRFSVAGDRLLEGYADPALPPKNDLVLMAHAISDFLIIAKQANDRPLSANEEWSAALRGQRPGAEPWFSNSSKALDFQQLLIDRWGTPLHFHALGNKQWEIRSAGPDRKLFTGDDLMEKFAG